MRDCKSSRMTHHRWLLAGPANRQGRIVADVIANRNGRFRGSQSTAIIGAVWQHVGMMSHAVLQGK
jgi:hypothetical protein